MDSLNISDNGGWYIDLVKDLFSERDQNLIISVPLSHFERKDVWMWGEEKNGKYFVKNEYKVIRNIENGSSITTPINWKFIWKFKVKEKNRNFLGRALSSCFPMLTALQSQRLEVVEWCPLCHHVAEDDLHSLVSIPNVRNVWSLSPFGSNSSPFYSLFQWWNTLI